MLCFLSKVEGVSRGIAVARTTVQSIPTPYFLNKSVKEHLFVLDVKRSRVQVWTTCFCKTDHPLAVLKKGSKISENIFVWFDKLEPFKLLKR